MLKSKFYHKGKRNSSNKEQGEGKSVPPMKFAGHMENIPVKVILHKHS